MLIPRLFRRRTASTVDCEAVEESARELARVRRSLVRRERRIAFLRNRLRDERRQHAAQLNARDEKLKQLTHQLVDNTPDGSTETIDTARLRQDFGAAMALLDEFEAEARKNRNALARTSELESENAAQRQIIATLEHEIQALEAWQNPVVVAA